MVAKNRKKSNRVYAVKYTDAERRTVRAWYNMWARFGGSAMRDVDATASDVDPAWRDLDTFLEDMGEKPVGSYLCRRVRTAPFGPENCYWGASRERNCANKRSGLNASKAYKAAKMILDGEYARDIAEALNVPISSIYNLSSGRTWKAEYSRAKLEKLGIL